MKRYIPILSAVGFGLAFSACADFVDTNNFVVEKPGSLGTFEYLNKYQPLKSYIDRSAHPGFTLGAAISVDDYIKKQQAYVVANSNFDMVTAGNAMKYASCVDDNGKKNFSKVQQFVAAAKESNMAIYGHCLAWHEQQRPKYLNGLLADKVDPNYKPGELVETKVHEDRRCLVVHSIDKVSDPWDSQFWIYLPGVSFAEGDSWEIAMEVRADKEASIGTQTHKGAGEYIHWEGIGTVSFTPSWSKYTANGTIKGEQAGGYSFAFNLNDFEEGNAYYFDNLSFKLNGQELLTNGDCENLSDLTNYKAKENNCGTISDAVIYDGIDYVIMQASGGQSEITEERGCVQVITQDKVNEAWDSQFWLLFPGTSFVEGDTWEVSMEVRADKEASIGTQTHKDPGAYIHWEGIGNVPFKPEWSTYTSSGSIKAEQAGGYSIAFNLNDFSEGNIYYFDNLSFKLNGKELIQNGDCEDPSDNTNYVAKEYPAGNGSPARIVQSLTYMGQGTGGLIPLTPEEKVEALTKELDAWIGGMMQATEGYVTAWDAVNEAISGGGDDGFGFYPLQSAEAAGNPADKFYWQDILGSENYVRTVVSLARKHFEANGGNPADLKLFVNDYNLESDWDQNHKVKSLVHWIERWEADGVTKIDGIGTQMHVSCYMNAQTQLSKQNAIENMFKILKESGKLVRITELDMGIVDENGNEVATENVTEEQHQAMAQFYKFIISKYFEIIPVDQQFGICQWCLTDSPANSGWRAGMPVGLWTLDWERKPAYAGFAEGLAGRSINPEE